MTTKLLDTVTIGAGGASSVTFSSIPQTHKDLHICIAAKSTASGLNRPLYTTISAAASASKQAIIFNYRDIFQPGAWPLNGNQYSTSFGLGYEIPGNTDAFCQGFYRFDLYNYASTTQLKAGVFRSGKNNTGSSSTAGNFLFELGTNLLQVTDAVSSITFTTTTSFAEHSVFCLYGIGVL